MHIQTINARLTNRRTLSRVIFYDCIMSNTFNPDIHQIVIKLLLFFHHPHNELQKKFPVLIIDVFYRVLWFY